MTRAHAGCGLRANLATRAADSVTARSRTAAHTTADHGAAATIATALAVDAGFVLLAAVIVLRITVQTADPFGCATEFGPRDWRQALGICERESVLAAFPGPLRRVRLTTTATAFASCARTALASLAAPGAQ